MYVRAVFIGMSYEDALRDGVLFCMLMNKLQPGLITKINTSGGDYKMMDNLNQWVLRYNEFKHIQENVRNYLKNK